MNNHFHLQHEHTTQNVAPQFLQQSGGATTFSYMSQPTSAPAPTLQIPTQLNSQQPQWMTYQILPSSQAMTISNGGGPKRYYATSTPTASTHPNTIQITNNYTQTQLPAAKQQPLQTTSTPFKANNIRIISTGANNIYNINKTAEQLFTPTTTVTPTADLYGPANSSTLQSFFLPNAEATTADNLSRLMANSNHNNNNNNTAKVLPTQPPPLVPVSSSHNVPPNGGAAPTVLLDRINICINNHYAESATPSNLCNTLSTSTLQPQQQPSPIIPAIQHKALMPLIDSSTADSSCSSSSSSMSLGRSSVSSNAAVIVIDEPDSTTATPQTPPTTPEAMSSPLKTPSIAGTPSPPPLSTSTILPKSSPQVKQSFTCVAQSSIERLAEEMVPAPLTPPTPPPTQLPEETDTLPKTTISYRLQEDVFIKCNDGRLYLGTIIDQAEQRYLVRFDDKSEQWCEPEKLRKLGGNSAQESSSAPNGPMCVACKRAQHNDVVEICERCGRGYHRGCTTETTTGSGIWCCKRCAKPMKMQQPLSGNEGKLKGICRQLPYHADKLSWDEKHRVNEEQIYCYCGKAGRFDHNMLQCCKCRNWFHTQCMQNFNRKLLRGDTFFVFCCTVCNDGIEFIRRLQIDWVDVLHITLYNLRKQQHQKYYHLLKDIWPFILKQRHQLPICAEWRALPETQLMERIKQTLKDYSERFVCGREFKRAPSCYALRHNGPPLTPKVLLQPNEVLSDELLVDKFKLLLLPSTDCVARTTKDVYEFQTDDEQKEDHGLVATTAADTSEDEIPIKEIMEKAKKQAKQQQLQPTLQLLVDDDNANDGQNNNNDKKLPVAPPQPPIRVLQQQTSRKRKAFRLSKSYKDVAAKRYDNSSSARNCDLSSDENSSSSRGTSSLDHIIPPPVNFLGRNNPFLMTTPKKNANITATQLRQGNSPNGITAGLINSIFNLNGALSATGAGLGAATTVAGCSIFPKLGSAELSRQQPRMVRTIKRRLSAKDITIGPNQEVRRRRTRRLTTAVEIINTTTINPIPSHYFPVYAKDLQQPVVTPPINNVAKLLPPIENKPSHGRLLRQRPRKSNSSEGNSRRSSTSSTATNGSSSAGGTSINASNGNSVMQDLKQSVNKYFGGAINRIDAGESFAIRAKRRVSNGQVQYLVEWGGDTATTTGLGCGNGNNSGN
ncbi:polycomb protein Pcl [Scaptodrosophila lebanonensis]|uniref:Polycomb protein Pcl n=1 Tax=Drosophila lebanonensis TaxID=7225 RepID=A0A6J2UEZ6_DROLE|nr:polycomb protein Pcl [Scaptodrosophila lebanonensis]